MGVLRSQWAEFKGMVDAYSIMYMEGLLLVPVVMAALFYPLEVLIAVAVVLLAGVAVFETALYIRHHPHHPHARKTGWRFPL
jgi:hypothetical protein